MTKKAKNKLSTKQVAALGGSMTEGLERASRSKNVIVNHDKTGQAHTVDVRDVVHDVLQSEELKEALHEDIMMLFENYLTCRVPYIVAKALKDRNFKKGDQPYMPFQLHNVYKDVVSENILLYATAKRFALMAIKKSFKTFIKLYVETIIKNITK